MTQKQLASEAQLSPQTLADYEREIRTPHHHNITAIENVFFTHGVIFTKGENNTITGLQKIE